MVDRARLVLGGADVGNVGPALSDADAARLLATAWELGIRRFDTAPHYGLGRSEQRLGAFLAGRSDYQLSTKVGRLLVPSPDTAHRQDDGFAVPADHRRVWDFSEAGIRRSLADSLDRMGLDRVDTLLLHDPDDQDPAAVGPSITSGVAALVALRSEGLVRRIGIGSKSTGALLTAVRTGDLDVVMVAGRYTLLERPAAAQLLPECRDRGVEVQVAGVFNSGLLATAQPPDDARYEYGSAPAAQLARARELAALCAASGVELPAAALQFPLRHPAVGAVVVGGSTPAQIRQNLRRAAAPIPATFWTQLERTTVSTGPAADGGAILHAGGMVTHE